MIFKKINPTTSSQRNLIRLNNSNLSKFYFLKNKIEKKKKKKKKMEKIIVEKLFVDEKEEDINNVID